MNLLVTNDDGIDSPGLRTLADAAAAFGSVTWVAPHENWSVCSHRITTDKPIRVVRQAENVWMIHGTPADCVRLGLAKLVPDVAYVLAGINHGGNLGADVHHSGTVAAVREAVLHGKPGIAFSHYRKRNMEFDWLRAGLWAKRVLEVLLPRPWQAGTYWNVNFPNLRADEPEPEIVFCPLDSGPLPLSFREDEGHFHYDGNYHDRVRTPGGDVEVCFGGNISVSLLRL